MVTVSRTARAVALGLLADLALGDPPTPLHPVGWYGAAMTRVERLLYRDSVTVGALHAGLGTTLAVVAASGCPSTAAATALCTAGRGLTGSAHAVATRLRTGDLAGARNLLPNLVGRDPSDLDEKEIVRAVVESVAENTVDAVVAPAAWALLAGSRGAFAHRGINTMDAMIGHRNDRYSRYGRAAARLDDVAAWLPARITALLVAGVRPVRARAILRAVRTQAPAHPSPNAGVAEAAYAAALGVRLGGTNRYTGGIEERPTLGTGPQPCLHDISRATAITRDVTIALVALLVAPRFGEQMEP